MPRESAELPTFFYTVENLFKVHDVPNDLKSKLLLPRLNYKAKSLVSKLSLAEMDCYEALRDHLLAEFKLTPRELRSRFLQATKRTDESYTLLAARLANLLTYYLRSRGALDDAKKMFELIVADKLKDILPPNVLHYVLSFEGDECFTPSKIASNADIYSSNYNERGYFRGNTVTNIRLDRTDNTSSTKYSGGFYSNSSTPSSHQPNAFYSRNKTVGEAQNTPSDETLVKGVAEATAESRDVTPVKATQSPVKRCFRCKSETHLISACPNKPRASPNKFQLKACMVTPSETEAINATPTASLCMSSALRNQRCESASVNDVTHMYESTLNIAELFNDSVNVKSSCSLQVSPLQYIDVCINYQCHCALIDSGCEVPLIHSRLLGDSEITSVGSTLLQPIFGPSVEAKLVAKDISLFDNRATVPQCNKQPVHISFAVSDCMVGQEVVYLLAL
jgi:hypothetical protein